MDQPQRWTKKLIKACENLKIPYKQQSRKKKFGPIVSLSKFVYSQFVDRNSANPSKVGLMLSRFGQEYELFCEDFTPPSSNRIELLISTKYIGIKREIFNTFLHQLVVDGEFIELRRIFKSSSQENDERINISIWTEFLTLLEVPTICHDDILSINNG